MNPPVRSGPPVNRYAASQVEGGSPLRRWVRALRWAWRRPRDLARLGEGSRITGRLRRVHPERISIGARTLVGPDCLMQPITTYLDQRFDPRIVIGDDCYIGPGCQFHGVDRIELGRGCVLSDQVYVSDVGHGLDPRDGLLMDRPVTSKGPVVLGDGCFVGFGALVLSGVTLGRDCVVGARSVVTRSFPAATMVAGNPARAIARFDPAAGKWIRLADVGAAGGGASA